MRPVRMTGTPPKMSRPPTPPMSPPMSPRPEQQNVFQLLQQPIGRPVPLPYPQVSNSMPLVTHPSRPQNGPSSQEKGRVMILCFDGTGNKFGEENSNVVRFFRALSKDKRKDQVVYYQPGIGTYNKRAFITHTMNTLSSALDSAIARGLDDHVKDGYTFIIQNYRPGDKICLFGFSRGAHTARVVAGMLYKVGVLPKENIQQVDFAFNIYMTTGYQGYKLSKEFKETFASPADIEFVGVWDTVSSVGIIPQMHPYTSINLAVNHFRHALALDERRARFRPNVWSELTLEREQELDVDIPVPKNIGPDVNRDTWQYEPPDRDHADVKEVWFAGCHADVGGGSHSTRRNKSLSSIPLRWMIKECILAKTGIQFDLEYLKEFLDFDFQDLLTEMGNKNIQLEELGENYKEIAKYASQSSVQEPPPKAADNASSASSNHPEIRSHGTGRHFRDIIDLIFDQLVRVWWFWWILEFIPMLSTYQDPQGNWIRRRMRNFGRGRYIPFYKNRILVHNSVKLRIDECGYKPNAQNWQTVKDSPMLQYID